MKSLQMANVAIRVASCYDLKRRPSTKPQTHHTQTHTYPKLHPLIQQTAIVEFAQQAGGGDAEGGGGMAPAATRHVAEEVVPQFSQQAGAAQQRHGGAHLLLSTTHTRKPVSL